MKLEDMDNLLDRMGDAGRDYQDFSELREPAARSAGGPRDWLLLQELGDATSHVEAHAWQQVVAAAEAFIKPQLEVDSSLQDEFTAMLSWVTPELPAACTPGADAPATGQPPRATMDGNTAATTTVTGNAPPNYRLFQRYAVPSRKVPVRQTPVRAILLRLAS
jgi:hypothetical protein